MKNSLGVAFGMLAVAAMLGLAAPREAAATTEKGSDVGPLQAKISGFVSLGILKSSQGTLLIKTLSAAQNRFDQERIDNAIALMINFESCVKKLGQAGQLPAWAVNCLLSMAEDVISLWSELN